MEITYYCFSFFKSMDVIFYVPRNVNKSCGSTSEYEICTERPMSHAFVNLTLFILYFDMNSTNYYY